MNIFVLDSNPVIASTMMHNKHVLKMLLESTQILCNCFDQDKVPYKRTHYNHPCCKWARESLENFNWLKQHALALCAEYTYRYGKIHKCQSIIESLPNPSITSKGLTSFAQCMPDQYKHSNAVTAYKTYYVAEKIQNAKWKNRPIPEFCK